METLELTPSNCSRSRVPTLRAAIKVNGTVKAKLVQSQGGKDSSNASSTTQLLRQHLKERSSPGQKDLVRSPGNLQGKTCSRKSISHISRKKTKEQLAQEQEEKEMKECTFKPKISAQQVKRTLSHSEKLNALSKPKTESIELREQAKRREEESSMYSYQPLTASKTINTSRSLSELTVSERLFRNAEEKTRNRERLSRESSETSLHSFRPQVSPSLHKRTPLYTRAVEVQKSRTAFKEQLTQQALQSPDLTFKPKISPTSVRLAGLRRVKSASTQSFSRQKSVAETPALTIQEKKKEIREKYSSKGSHSSFKSLKMPVRSTSKADTCSFKPEINTYSKILIETDRKRNTESFDEKIKRIGTEEALRRKQNLQEKEELKHTQFSFEPKIDMISRLMGRTPTIEELSSPLTARKTNSKIMLDSPQECSFQPEICQNYAHVKSHYKQGRDVISEITLNTALKEEKLRKARKTNEYQKIKDCTFKPEKEKRINIYSLVEVKGTDRFMELREMANKQQSDKEKREEKVLNKKKPNANTQKKVANGYKTFTFKPKQVFNFSKINHK